jgi:uridylate kinase
VLLALESGAVKKPAYKRILLKLSGEALLGDQKYGVDPAACRKIALSIQELTKLGVQVGLVIGGGNIFRGVKAAQAGLSRTPADHIGMLATLINGISLQQAFQEIHCLSRLMSAMPCDTIAESYSWRNTLKYFEQGAVVTFVGGTGSPYFTTDSAAALRALEIEAEILMKATKVDGIYDKDPLKFPNAVKFNQVTYSEVLAKQLQVMDATAIALCRENHIPIRVFDLFSDDSLKRAIFNESVGTLVAGE